MSPASAPTTDGAVLDAVRAGDEAAFARLVRDHSGVLREVARCYDPRGAEQVVQDTWLAVIDGINGQRALLHRARTTARAALARGLDGAAELRLGSRGAA
jgi:DNA-directed RNA polymerase specialized sigma24 family protein